MNNKFIMLFIVILNVMTITLATMGGQQIGLYSDALNTLFDLDIDATTGGINVTSYNNDVTEQTNKFSQGEQGIVSNAVGGFFDVFRIVTGFIGLLTPFPIFALLNSLNVVWFVNVLLTVPLTLLWIIGLFEMVRGGSF